MCLPAAFVNVCTHQTTSIVARQTEALKRSIHVLTEGITAARVCLLVAFIDVFATEATPCVAQLALAGIRAVCVHTNSSAAAVVNGLTLVDIFAGVTASTVTMPTDAVVCSVGVGTECIFAAVVVCYVTFISVMTD